MVSFWIRGDGTARATVSAAEHGIKAMGTTRRVFTQPYRPES